MVSVGSCVRSPHCLLLALPCSCAWWADLEGLRVVADCRHSCGFPDESVAGFCYLFRFQQHLRWSTARECFIVCLQQWFQVRSGAAGLRPYARKRLSPGNTPRLAHPRSHSDPASLCLNGGVGAAREAQQASKKGHPT